MYIVKRYMIPFLVLSVMILMYLDEPNIALNRSVLTSSLSNAQGVGDLLADRVFDELEKTQLVCMVTSDFAYRARQTTGIFVILLLLWAGEYVTFGKRFDRIEDKVDSIEYWVTMFGDKNEE